MCSCVQDTGDRDERLGRLGADQKLLSFLVEARDPARSGMGTDSAGPTDPSRF